MPVDPETLRHAMRNWATGVTIVAARDGEVAHGMTVSSFTSLSLDPPLVMISLQQNTRTHQLLEDSGVFGVTILAEDQASISNRFADQKTELGNRFAGLESCTLVTGSPFIQGGLAFFDCRIVARYPGGTHSVFVGEVLAVKHDQDKGPLIYFSRGYRKIEG